MEVTELSLRAPDTIKSVDIRTLLRVASPTLSDIYRKLGVEYADPTDTPKKGSAKHIYSHDARQILEMRGYVFPRQAEAYSFVMCKGGVGKTTSTYFLSQRMAAYGARVLAIDADSQGNLTSAFDLEKYGFEVGAETPILVDIITNSCSVRDAIVEVSPTLHLLPSTPMNANLEGRIREGFKNPSLPIKRLVDSVRGDYDFLLIDCAPALNLTNASIVCASDALILPVAPDKFSQLGLEQTLNEVSQLEEDFSFSVKKRIVFTKFDGREFTSLKYLSEIATTYDEKLRFNTAIRTCADVKNVITRKEDLFAIKKSNAREDYDALAREIMGLDAVLKRRRPTTKQRAAG